MIPSKCLPKLVVTLSIDNPLQVLEHPLSNIVTFTVESAYNIPDAMKPEMDYKACTQLPIHNMV